MQIRTLKEKIKKLKKSKGFTLIELIVVIAVIGVLVLLAAPKFVGYVAEAKMTQVKNDIKAYENAIVAKLQKDESLTKNWQPVERDKMIEMRDKDSLYTIKGEVPDNYEFKEYYLDIPEDELSDEIKSKLPGDFVWGSDGKVYYEDNKLAKWSDKDKTKDTDGDGLIDKEEDSLGTDINKPDTDGDGLTDKEEVDGGTNPLDKNDPGNDADGDGLQDHIETQDGTDPNKKDTDGDGLNDKEEKDKGTNPLKPDTDDDGVKDGQEVADGTDPLKADTDGDGLTDGDEKTQTTNPLSPDTDNDGINDGSEIQNSTNPLDPNDPGKDTDGDGIKDHIEVQNGTSPTDPNDPGKDTDGDGVLDHIETQDGTDPTKPDTDVDGLTDGEEKQNGTDPLNSNDPGKDTDGDGLKDTEEASRGTNPTNPDTDNDGKNDKEDPNPLVWADYVVPSIKFGALTGWNPYGNPGLEWKASDDYKIKETNMVESQNYVSGAAYNRQIPSPYYVEVGAPNMFQTVASSGSDWVQKAQTLQGKAFEIGAKDANDNISEFHVFVEGDWIYAKNKITGKTYVVTPSMPEYADSSSGALSGYKYPEHLVLPDKVNGQTVYGFIGEGYVDGAGVKTITIPESYEYISGIVRNAPDLEKIIYHGDASLETHARFTSFEAIVPSNSNIIVEGRNPSGVTKLVWLLEDISGLSGYFKGTYVN